MAPTPRQPVRNDRQKLPLLLFVIVLFGAALYAYNRHQANEAAEQAAERDRERAALASAPPPTAARPQATPYSTHHLYDETIDPHTEISAALARARAEHKRVIVDFGGDWCGDCQVLDIYLHQPPNTELVDNNFVVAHVFIGHIDKNLDIPEGYGIPIHKGVPALAVLDANGKVLYAQHGEFEDMRHMDAQSVTDFLNKWKA